MKRISIFVIFLLLGFDSFGQVPQNWTSYLSYSGSAGTAYIPTVGYDVATNPLDSSHTPHVIFCRGLINDLEIIEAWSYTDNSGSMVYNEKLICTLNNDLSPVPKMTYGPHKISATYDWNGTLWVALAYSEHTHGTDRHYCSITNGVCVGSRLTNSDNVIWTNPIYINHRTDGTIVDATTAEWDIVNCKIISEQNPFRIPRVLLFSSLDMSKYYNSSEPPYIRNFSESSILVGNPDPTYGDYSIAYRYNLDNNTIVFNQGKVFYNNGNTPYFQRLSVSDIDGGNNWSSNYDTFSFVYGTYGVNPGVYLVDVFWGNNMNDLIQINEDTSTPNAYSHGFTNRGLVSSTNGYKIDQIAANTTGPTWLSSYHAPLNICFASNGNLYYLPRLLNIFTDPTLINGTGSQNNRLGSLFFDKSTPPKPLLSFAYTQNSSSKPNRIKICDPSLSTNPSYEIARSGGLNIYFRPFVAWYSINGTASQRYKVCYTSSNSSSSSINFAQPQTFPVLYSKNNSNGGTVSGPSSIDSGDSIQFTINKNSGYRIEGVTTTNGLISGSEPYYTLSNVIYPILTTVTVSVNFVPL